MSGPGAPIKAQPDVTPITTRVRNSPPSPEAIYTDADDSMLLDYLSKKGYSVGLLTATTPAKTTVSPPSSAMTTLKLTPPARYEGDPEGLQAFLHNIEFFLVASGVPLDNVQAVSVAAYSLHGLAATWFHGVVALAKAGEVAPIVTFADFAAALTQWVRPVEPVQKYYDDLFGMQLGKSQSVKDYISAFNRARSRVPVALPDVPLLHLFLRGLPRPVQRQILPHNPPSLAKCYELANVITDLSNSVSQSGGSTSGSGGSSAGGQGSVICSYCNQPGHAESNCYTKYPDKRPGKGKSGKKVSIETPPSSSN